MRPSYGGRGVDQQEGRDLPMGGGGGCRPAGGQRPSYGGVHVDQQEGSLAHCCVLDFRL